jgi:PAS domain S-box-containing protein
MTLRQQDTLDAVWQAVNVSAEAVCLCDARNRFVRVNGRFTQLYGWRAEELTCQSPARLVPADTEPALLSEVNRATREAGGWEGDLVNVRRDGATLRIHLRTAAVRSRGTTVGFVGFAHPWPESPAADLSPTQQRIFALLAAGQAPKQIADTLACSESTVREHLRRMMAKLAVPDLASLTLCAVRHGCQTTANFSATY